MFQLLIQSFNLTPEMTQSLLEIIVLLLVASILSYLIARTIWKRKLRKEQARYNELEEKHVALNGELDDLKQKYTALLLQKKQLADKLSLAKDGSRSLQVEIDNLQPYKVRYETVKINYDRAKEQVAALEEHIRRVEGENEELKHNIELEAQKTRELTAEYTEKREDAPGAAIATNAKEKITTVKDRLNTMLNKSEVASALEEHTPQTYDFGKDEQDSTKDLADLADEAQAEATAEIQEEAEATKETAKKEGSGWWSKLFGGGKKDKEKEESKEEG